MIGRLISIARSAAMTFGTLAGIAIAVGIFFWMHTRLEKFNRRQQEVIKVIADAGYVPFGTQDGSYRTFQSKTSHSA